MVAGGLRLKGSRLLNEAGRLSGEEPIRGGVLRRLRRGRREEVERGGGGRSLGLLGKSVLSEEPVRRHRRHRRLLLLKREPSRLGHDESLPEGVEAGGLGREGLLLLLLLRGESELRLLGRREAAAERGEACCLWLKLHRHLLLTKGRGLLSEELRLLRRRHAGLLLLETSGERIEGRLLIEIGRGGTGRMR